MRFQIVFAFALLASASAELVSRSVVLPTIESEGRITNGNDAAVGQFPYQVGLSLRVNVLSSAWCGGSLIGSQWVLTAAHCTDGISSITVYLGATVRTVAELTYTVPSSDVIIHAGWNGANLRNDISLIRIPTTTFTALIQPVTIPAKASSYSTFVGENVIASGWGRTSDTASAVATDLQWAQMTVITNTACAAIYGANIVTPSNVCVATTGGVSTCNGDSGGPLVLASTGVQIGLTSFGAAAGCSLGYPAAFTRLTSFLDWIEDHTGISY